MNLAIIGASDEELRGHLDQAATAADLQISYPEQTEAWRGLTDEDEEWDILVWFAPNIGPVKSGYYMFDEQAQEQVWVGQELLRYELGG